MRNEPSRRELTTGLRATPAEIPAKYLYDDIGCCLFDLITRLPEYYPTRTESAVMKRHVHDIVGATGTGASLIDLGAGNCQKARALFPLLRPRHYVAVDISMDYLRQAVSSLQLSFPAVDMFAVGADLSAPVELPAAINGSRRLFFYPGSSIGNLDPEAAAAFLSRIRVQCGGRGGLLIGVDLVKDVETLHAAYNDALGVTAAFNLNVLNHVNALIGSDFRPAEWRHRAFYDAARQRIEMHLEAARDVAVSWPGGERRFRAGESLHTENSYKYRLDDFAAMLRDSGFRDVHAWTDERQWFAVCYAGA